MNATELKTLRRLIDENIDQIISAMIDADIANMEEPDMHDTHAVLLMLDSNIRIEKVKRHRHSGPFGSCGWVVYASKKSGDDRACSKKDFRENAIHDNIYSDELSAALAYLDLEIAVAEHNEALEQPSTPRTLEDIRRMLLNDGINFALVMEMTDSELIKADSYDDYDDYNDFMNYLAYKYDI